jgi:1-acyl-sn-glycerol-3-phosphate acyltransferase
MWLIKNFIVIMYSLLIAILSLLVFPIDYHRKVSGSLMRIWTRTVLVIYGVKVNVIGAENVKPGEGKIYISNHASYLDIFVQLAKLPDSVRMVYKKEINIVPLLGWAMAAVGFVSIDRKNVRSAMRSLDKAAERIKKGLSIVIYPEGTRTRDGSVGEFKRGMFYLAEKSEADIVPVTLSNSFQLMPGGSGRVKSGVINMVIGKPLKYKKDKEFLNEIREIVISNLKPV